MFKHSLLCALVAASLSATAPLPGEDGDLITGIFSVVSTFDIPSSASSPTASISTTSSLPIISPSALPSSTTSSYVSSAASSTSIITVSFSSTESNNTTLSTASTSVVSPTSIATSSDSVIVVSPTPITTSNDSVTVVSSSGMPSSGLETSTASAPPQYATVTPASDDPNEQIFAPESNDNPEPIRNQLGANILGPENIPIDMQNPDLLAPPTTDHGTVANAKWPFSLSHNRLQTGGWARQQNTMNFPSAKKLASVDMRLKAGAIRELHWHSAGEWAYVLKGYAQVSAVNTDGQNFIDTIGPGDIWYFPAGIPHSIQATSQDPDGVEFLLIFDSGSFNEDNTFLLTDWLSHVPKEVIAKNFQADISDFNNIPSEELYIFPSNAPDPDQQDPLAPNGTIPNPFTFHWSQVNETQLSGGSMKIVDTKTFLAGKTIVGALVNVEPGAMRELHWHPTQPEWDYFINGTGRMTIYAASGNARTFDYVPGDVGYVPPSYGHYVENTGNTTLTFLEIYNSDLVEDISLQQWLALTPPALVQAHLGLSNQTIQNLKKTKLSVVA